jgi:hypothetical protein
MNHKVSLKTPAVVLDTMAEECYDESINCENGFDKEVAKSGEESVSAPLLKLPEKLSVLFVDDDSVFRKLFARAIRNSQGHAGMECPRGRKWGNGSPACRQAELRPDLP